MSPPQAYDARPLSTQKTPPATPESGSPIEPDAPALPPVHDSASADPTPKTRLDITIPAKRTAAARPAAQTTVADSPGSVTTSSPEQSDIWQRIRKGFAMRDMNSPLVARHQKWYANRPEYMARMTERAQRYLYFIVEEVEKRGMPTEIALLPMIESAFNPGAYSGARASGIWQFIPSTGKNFGMQQNWWYDGRRDVISATTGALDYLQKLHDEFGDWDLALAAYNCGENAVRRAQERNRKLHRPVDYASLKLPPETRNYVPKLLAIKNIINNPVSFNLTLRPIPDEAYFSTVVTARHIDVKLAAELAEIPLEEFLALNPAHNRPVILQENADILLLPVDKVEIFRSNLAHYPERLVSWQAYPAKNGERLDKVATSFGMSVAKLRTINGLSPHTRLSNGQDLLVPLNTESAVSEFTVFNTDLVPFDIMLANAVRHTVRKGDTLSSIARRYRVRLSSLLSWNKGVKILRPGQRIYVAQPGRSGPLAKSGKSRIKTAAYRKANNPKRATYAVR